MSDRLTPKWTVSTELAFGLTGKRGREGELYFAKTLETANIPFEEFEDNILMQTQGIDFKVYNITIDVKSNLRSDGSFFIEKYINGWLHCDKKTNDIIVHLNPHVEGCVWYNREEMKSKLKPDLYNKKALLLIDKNNIKPFMHVGWKSLFDYMNGNT